MDILIRFDYIVEILLAEWVFLHIYPKRRCFFVRLLVTIAVSLAVGYGCYPKSISQQGAAIVFVQMLFTILVSVIGMYVCCKGTLLSVLSACISGVAIQHIGHHLSRLISLLPGMGTWNRYMAAVVCLFLYAVVFYFIHTSHIKFYENYDVCLTVISIVIVLVCVGITRFSRMGGYGAQSENPYLTISIALYAITCNLLALFIQFFLCRFIRLKSEYAVLQRIRTEEKRQYESSCENSELMNLKYHDLKHKLTALQTRLPEKEIESMQELLQVYDTTYHTGLEVLDIILNEKCRQALAKKISITCMGDGKALRFMDTMDIYSLFGNILENAVEAVENIEPAEKRVISLTIEQRGEMVFIDAMNYCGNKSLTYENGLPITTKTTEYGYHGFGLKSIRAIAEKYNGDVETSLTDGVFKVNVYMMVNDSTN